MNYHLKIPTLLTVRTKSSRLPEKCLKNLGTINVLEHIIIRAKHFKLIPIICTTNSKSDDRIIKIAENHNIAYFRGNELNKINRWLNCLLYFNLEACHLLDVDDFYFDPNEIKSSWKIFHNGNYDAVLCSSKSDAGFASVGHSVNLSFIKKLNNLLNLHGIENVDAFPWEIFIDHEKVIRLNDSYISSLLDLRLTLDYDQDFELLELLYNRFGSISSRKKIEKYLEKNVDVVNINLKFNRKFLERQKLPNIELRRILQKIP